MYQPTQMKSLKLYFTLPVSPPSHTSSRPTQKRNDTFHSLLYVGYIYIPFTISTNFRFNFPNIRGSVVSVCWWCKKKGKKKLWSVQPCTEFRWFIFQYTFCSMYIFSVRKKRNRKPYYIYTTIGTSRLPFFLLLFWFFAGWQLFFVSDTTDALWKFW